jgi:23S rRNA maturation-related 3'-5' exoribonuclease YhaM
MIEKKTPATALAGLREIADYFFPVGGTDKLRAVVYNPLNSLAFQNGWGCDPSKPYAHHAYPGGLLVHTYEVAYNAGAMAEEFGGDPKIVVPAAVWHDYGKIWDYDSAGAPTDYKSKIYHISGSYAYFVRFALSQGIAPNTIDAIGHCILAHHGFDANWGSAVEPQTAEALFIHQADMWSARYGPGRVL